MTRTTHLDTLTRHARCRLRIQAQHCLWLLLCAISIQTLCSCVKEEQFDDTPQGNFEALWQIIDKHYCFLDQKYEALGVDWNEVHGRYAERITPSMNRKQCFEVLSEMLGELQDGHVNLYAAHDLGRNWSWQEDFPPNFYPDIQDDYLGKDYQLTSGMKYRIFEDNIGYVTCPSFTNGIGEGNLDEIFYYLRLCDGLILDLRNNGGGNLTNAERLAARFTNERLHVGWFRHKTGPGHNDFSDPVAEYLDPSIGVRWQKRAVVLTNRSCYSSANAFIRDIKCCPQVTVLGDQTGGGSGMPFSSELPNGWTVRFSASPMYDTQMNHIEQGIAPDIVINFSEEDRNRGKDTLIEAARRLLSER